MTKQEFLDLSAKEEKTEDEQAQINAYAKEFQEKYYALSDEYGLDFSVKADPRIELTIKK